MILLFFVLVISSVVVYTLLFLVIRTYHIWYILWNM